MQQAIQHLFVGEPGPKLHDRVGLVVVLQARGRGRGGGGGEDQEGEHGQQEAGRSAGAQHGLPPLSTPRSTPETRNDEQDERFRQD